MEINQLEILQAYLQILIDGPNWKKGKPAETAILVLPGKHQEYRITESVKLWKKEGDYFWVAGTRGDPAYTREDIIKVTGDDSSDIVCQGFAEHTLAQMQWCALMLKENPQIKYLIVATAAYHLPRCILTLLQVFKKEGVKMLITPMPLENPSGNSFSVEDGEDFTSELKKIPQYQEKGDVLSVEDWIEYLAWRRLTNQ
ncbi:YdcF family protein [Candidatus Parcubacteria bacterium]|nr:YdcF family protein [Candidatus Parcubacteria bacterium]